MEPDALTEHTLIGILLNPPTRKHLFAAMAEEGEPWPLANRFAELAGCCRASPTQLRAAILACLDDDKEERHAHWLIHHPNVPHDLLLDLARQEVCLTALAHRRGPRALLEQLVTHHRISEAITTLALDHYRFENDSAFATFVAEHSSDYMLRWNHRRADLTPSKRAIVDSLPTNGRQ